MTSTMLADLETSMPRQPPPGSDITASVTLHNVVATANFGVPINLERLAWAFYGEYNPRTFAAVHLRLREPKTTALVFSSGRIVCTGSPSEYAALTALNIYLHMVQSLQPEARMVTQTIQNIVSVGNLGSSVRIDALARALVLRSAYDPEIFPGLRLKLRHPPMKVLVFCGGKCVLTGGRNRTDVARAWAALRLIVDSFLCRAGDNGGEKAPTHEAISTDKAARRKRKYF